jgi:two-component system, chemotaxis family, protein-glutamate methylesterase/glutaminase
MKKIRVLIIEDSKVVRELLEHIIGSDLRLEIAAVTESAEEALAMLEDVSPDVISMDIRLPGMNGLEATQRIMTERPTPIVVVSGSDVCQDLQISIKALQAGALAVLEKPAGVTSADYEPIARRLCTQLAIMSQVKLVRRRIAVGDSRATNASVAHARAVLRPAGAYRMLGIVSSTGGPGALARLLPGLGSGYPLPIALVQHITTSFTEGFASWLESVSPFAVTIVRDRVLPVPGNIYLAAPEHHLRMERGTLLVDRGDRVCGQRPSGTVLFESMASNLGSGALGVLLTGMGEDGASGLLRLRSRGGHTIAEDASTAVVYGMPAEAVRLGAVCESLPLPAIAPRILDLTLSMQEVA